MENTMILQRVLNILNAITVSGKRDMTNMLACMNSIEKVIENLTEEANKKEE